MRSHETNAGSGDIHAANNRPQLSNSLHFGHHRNRSGKCPVRDAFQSHRPVGSDSSWKEAQLAGVSMPKLTVVTVDHPDRRQSCRAKSFTPDKLVRSRVIGSHHTYRLDQVVAIIVPGDGGSRLPIWLALNFGSGRSNLGHGCAIGDVPSVRRGYSNCCSIVLRCRRGGSLWRRRAGSRSLLGTRPTTNRKLGYVQDRL